MEKWKITVFIMCAGITPVTVALVVMQQFEFIGPLRLLAVLYFLFVCSCFWCRRFAKFPPCSPEQKLQVDTLPSYEDAIKSDPPPYYTLYPECSTSYDVKTSGNTNASLESKAAAGSGSVDIPSSSELEKKTSFSPIFTISNEDQTLRGIQRTTLVSELDPCPPPTFGSSMVFPAACYNSEPRPSHEVEKRILKKKICTSKCK